VWVWVLGAKGQRVQIDPELETAARVDSPALTLAVSLDHLRRLRGRYLDEGERPGPGERVAAPHRETCPVLVAAREAAASYVRARAAARAEAPSFHDTDALREARAEREAARLAVLVDGDPGDGRPARKGRR
jgi:hypothetical protein